MDERLPIELGEDQGRPADVEPIAADDHRPDLTGTALQELLRRVADEQQRLRAVSHGRQLANLQPEAAPIRHGVHARQGVYMRCDRCPIGEGCEQYEPEAYCRPEEEYVERRTGQIMAVDYIDPDRDAAAVRQLVWLEVRIERAARYIAMHGEVDPAKRGNYYPIAKDVQGLLNTHNRLLEKLALTPAAARAMAESGQSALGDLAAAILGQRGTASGTADGEVVEGNFEVEEEGESSMGGSPVGEVDEEGETAAGKVGAILREEGKLT